MAYAVLTRDPADAQAYAAALAPLGFEVVAMPVTRTVPPADRDALARALAGDFAAIVIASPRAAPSSSARAVRGYARCSRRGRSPRSRRSSSSQRRRRATPRSARPPRLRCARTASPASRSPPLPHPTASRARSPGIASRAPAAYPPRTMNYPDYRPRRMRRTASLRRMIRETRLAPDDFVYPLFVVPGSGVQKPIGSLPGQFNLSVDKAVDAAQAAADLGIPAVILFGIPEHKDAVGSEAWKDQGVVQKAIRAIKKARPELVVMADAC